MLAGIRRSRVTIAVVVSTFTAASVAAYQVYNAVCAQESAAQRALLSHARFAAWTFTREANAELERAARRVLSPTITLAAAGKATGAPSAAFFRRSLDPLQVPRPALPGTRLRRLLAASRQSQSSRLPAGRS